MSVGKRVHTAQNVEQSGFTGTRRSYDDTYFAFLYFKGGIPQSFYGNLAHLIYFFYMFKLNISTHLILFLPKFVDIYYIISTAILKG